MLSRKMLIFLWLLPSCLFSQYLKFNADSTYAYTEHLSVNIGPRPMGSLNERKALQWVAAKFVSFSADTVFILPFYKLEAKKSSVNTNSGTTVAIFRGEVDSAIVIGGHIDSAGREFPGANDNASGTASVIELARIWSLRPRHYSMVFAAFGGEEQGLVGSKHFVKNFPKINKVVLMVCLDMTGSDDNIISLAESDYMQAPAWLIKDAFDIDRALGINRLQYPNFFAATNNIGGGAGSDHIPFLDKKIPAIDFTAGINNSPIHTQQDKIDFIDKNMLAACGSLADSLLVFYQKFGLPKETNRRYMLWRVFGHLLFLPSWSIIAFNAMSLLISFGAFYFSRKNRLWIEKSQRVQLSGLKLLLMFIVVVIFFQLGEGALQLIKGMRYPWFIHLYEYLWYGAAWAVAGLWSTLQLTKKWRFSDDPHVYAQRALIILFLLTAVVTVIGYVRLAFYPALVLLLFSLAIMIPFRLIKTILVFAAPLPLLRLMFDEVIPFKAHFSIGLGFSLDSFLKAFFYSGILAGLMIFWYLPFIYMCSYLIVVVRPIKLIAKFFRKPRFAVLIAIVIMGYGVYLFSLPAYTKMWRPSIRVEAEYDIQKQESKLQLVGNEYFKDASVKTDSAEKHFSARSHKEKLAHTFAANWLEITGTETVLNTTADTLNVKASWQVISQRPWYNVYFQVQVDTLEFKNVQSDLNFYFSKDRFTFSWRADPPETLTVAAQFAMIKGSKLIRKVDAYYPEMPFPIQVKSDFADLRYRTQVTYQDTVEVKKGETENFVEP